MREDGKLAIHRQHSARRERFRLFNAFSSIVSVLQAALNALFAIITAIGFAAMALLGIFVPLLFSLCVTSLGAIARLFADLPSRATFQRHRSGRA
jgi:hypothetical protein